MNRPNDITVTLSRSNLLALLAKLDGYPTGSLASISRVCEDNRLLVVIAQEDEEHYADREGIRGRMHPDTEQKMKVDFYTPS